MTLFGVTLLPSPRTVVTFVFPLTVALFPSPTMVVMLLSPPLTPGLVVSSVTFWFSLPTVVVTLPLPLTSDTFVVTDAWWKGCCHPRPRPVAVAEHGGRARFGVNGLASSAGSASEDLVHVVVAHSERRDQVAPSGGEVPAADHQVLRRQTASQTVVVVADLEHVGQHATGDPRGCRLPML